MAHLKNVTVAIVMSVFVASCFSGSSTQSSTSTKKPAAKRLGGSSQSSTTAPSSSTSTDPANSAPKSSSSATTTETGGAQTLRTLYVNVNSANVRAMPSKDATIVAKVKYLDPIGATGVLDGEWVQVEVTMSDGALGKGWIHSTLVSASKDQAEATKAAGGN